ncbi:MAG: L-rhamnose mutarotase [Janthinobacterium lividum]
MRRFCLMLDLRPDAALIEEYIAYHQAVWPEIQASIRDAGVLDMQIYNAGNRLFMIMDTADDFTLQKKAAMDAANPKVLEWETLMGRFQQVDVDANPTTRWIELTQIFQLT